jgi:Ca2+-binding EF-hand superfamily protein
MFDDNGDGKIDMKELIAGLELLTNGTDADKLTFLFKVYDIDGELTIALHMKSVVSSDKVNEILRKLHCNF